jgi:hypothetical protein
MRILKTRVYFAGENTVEVYREVTPDEVKMVQFWVPIIKDGVLHSGKPEPLIVGQDHWPDWDRLVARAKKKMSDAKRRNSKARQKVSDFSIRKGGIAFFMGGDGSSASAEITKRIIIKDE